MLFRSIISGPGAGKFGLTADEVGEAIDRLHLAGAIGSPGAPFDLLGLHAFGASNVRDADRLIDGVRAIATRAEGLAARHGVRVRWLDAGGGLGIPYRGEVAPSIEDYAAVLAEELVDRPHTVIVEPGRALVGPAGLLLTRVEYEKDTRAKRFLVVDAAMNDLLRPALYGAHHEVVELAPREPRGTFDVAGPVCESADTLAREQIGRAHV